MTHNALKHTYAHCMSEKYTQNQIQYLLHTYLWQMDNIKSRVLVVTVIVQKHSFYSFHSKDFCLCKRSNTGLQPHSQYVCINLITYAGISFVIRIHFSMVEYTINHA